MKIVILGLTNGGLTNGYRQDGGHSMRWRALIHGLAIRGHRVVAVERAGPGSPVPWTIPGGEVLSYGAWDEVAVTAAAQADDAGVALVVAQGPDARLAADLVRQSKTPRRVLYDPEAPVSLTALEAGEAVDHLPADGLAGFDMVLASCGGPALDRYRAKAGLSRWPRSIPGSCRRPTSPATSSGSIWPISAASSVGRTASARGWTASSSTRPSG
ncbi:hypothetical protein ACHMW5_27085 [Azospirillum melinis]|uniref:hypothetical protein n=1 Tax=Azospirillum melinis TaxID=328839 RepID=UPI003757C9FA